MKNVKKYPYQINPKIICKDCSRNIVKTKDGLEEYSAYLISGSNEYLCRLCDHQRYLEDNSNSCDVAHFHSQDHQELLEDRYLDQQLNEFQDS